MKGMHTDIIDHDSGMALPHLRALQPLRDLHRLNAAFSGITGVAMAASSGWLSRRIDLPRSFVVVLGVGLVGWAALLIVLAVQPARRVVRASPFVATGDAMWVLATAALLLSRQPTATGTTFAITAAAVVAALATAGFVLVGRARHSSPHDRTEVLFRSVTVAAPPAAAWHMVIDADLYARLAPNLSTITVAPDECARTCTDTRGNRWTEEMHLDHERHVQHIEVDVDQHPMPLDRLAATISVHNDSAGSRIDLAFTYITRPTLRGLAASLALPLFGRRLLQPIAVGWAHDATPSVPSHSTGGAAR